ncbi:MAG: Lrp/AsnC family transcriptional regulator [Dehalococcoidales bacterium]|nr:Lrp/AsnC family transcriptional regulator [Dehalococcoidales bacterium]
MLNSIDLRLIKRLEVNGRAGYKELADSLGISPSTAAKRVNRLIFEGIISVKAVPNPLKLGQPAGAVIAVNVPLNRIDAICDNLQKSFHINMIATTLGRFNLVLGVHFPSWEELIAFIFNEIQGNGETCEFETYFVKSLQERPSRGESEDLADKNFAGIDRTDFRIIEELVDDGRQSCIHLAEKLGLSLSSVSRRLDRLLKENVIQVRALVNTSRLGYHYNAFIFLRVEQHFIQDIRLSLETFPEIVSLVRLTNGYDMLINVLAESAESLHYFIKTKLLSLPGIIKNETLIRSKLIKNYYGGYNPVENNG